MKRSTGLATILALFAVALITWPAIADPMEATISLGRDPEPPFCVDNPGGTLDIDWNIEHETTPNYVLYQLWDPTQTVVLEEETYPGNTGITVSRQWTVPAGAVDGKYWVRVEYWSFEAGNEANAEVTFYVCNGTGTICATKYVDADCDGELTGQDPVVPDFWICIETPYGDEFCLQTNDDGVVCWEGLQFGDYTVFEPEVPGWIPIYPASVDVVLDETTPTADVTFFNLFVDDCVGACCIGHDCYIMMEQECIDSDGLFLGIGTVCEPNPCDELTPAQDASWGEIKAIYR